MDDSSLNEVRRVIRRANFRLKAEENEAAFNLFRKALEYLPESVEIMNTLGTLSIKMGNIDDGIRYYRDSSVIKEELNTQIELGFALLINNQVEEAHEIFSELNLDDADVKAGLGISLVLLNQDLQRATDLMARADRYDMGINISTFLGLAYFQLGQYNKALTEFRKNSSSWENVHAIGVLYITMDSLSRANHNFEDAYRKYEQEVGINNVDETIINKISFDKILSEPDPRIRLQFLLSLIDGRTENLELYMALIATQYDISSYESPLEEYIEKTKEYVDADQNELNDRINAWLEKTKEEGS